MDNRIDNSERAVFAAGCFWGVEAAFKRLPGVLKTRVGYTGGHVADPEYQEVCSGSTGHIEACEVVYVPSIISFEDLLVLFWRIHDPTQQDGQGNDHGTQYLSAIFFHTTEQERTARASLLEEEESGRHGGRIATRILPACVFWDAEEYHQKYLDRNPGGYCHINMAEVNRVVSDIARRRQADMGGRCYGMQG